MKIKTLMKIKSQRVKPILEKSIIGFMSFAVMTLTSMVDMVTGAFGSELVIQEFIYNSFVIITLGCFGIAGAEKIFSGKK